MKKWLVLTVLGAMLACLTGCSRETVLETVADELLVDAAADPGQILLELPPEAAAAALESDQGEYYQCDGYDILLQTLEAGDLEATVRQVSGFSRDRLTILQTTPGQWKRYDLVWSAMAQEGEMVGRATILDDGYYHYVLTVLAPADSVPRLEETWEGLFQSFSLTSY